MNELAVNFQTCNSAPRSQQTLLMQAARYGDLVEMLLNAGADTSLMTPDDVTALELAANRKIMRLLRRHQA